MLRRAAPKYHEMMFHHWANMKTGLELATQLHMVTVKVCSSHVLEMVFHYWASIKTGLEL
jgi:hypothetical protein